MKRACERGYEQGHRCRPQPHSRTACRRQPRPSGMNAGAARARRRALRPLRLIIVRAALGATCRFMTSQGGQQRASPGKLQHEYQRTQPQYNAQPLGSPRDPGTVSASPRRTAGVNRLHDIDPRRWTPMCQIGGDVRPEYPNARAGTVENRRLIQRTKAVFSKVVWVLRWFGATLTSFGHSLLRRSSRARVSWCGSLTFAQCSGTCGDGASPAQAT
jgi:hypothetical protein